MIRKVLFIVFAILLVIEGFTQARPHPGVIDASSFDFKQNRLNLAGTWLWFDGRLLQPDQKNNPDLLPVEFPVIWNERRADGNGQGYATYFLSVIVPTQAEDLALDLPDIYSSYILFVN